MSSDERLTAIHEAGHAIVAGEYGLEHAELVLDDPDDNGHTGGWVNAAFESLDPRHNAAAALAGELATALAGELATAIAGRSDFEAAVGQLVHDVGTALNLRQSTSARPSDVEHVARLLATQALDWLADALADALEVLLRRWADVETLADRLLAERTVTQRFPQP